MKQIQPVTPTLMENTKTYIPAFYKRRSIFDAASNAVDYCLFAYPYDHQRYNSDDKLAKYHLFDSTIILLGHLTAREFALIFKCTGLTLEEPLEDEIDEESLRKATDFGNKYGNTILGSQVLEIIYGNDMDEKWHDFFQSGIGNNLRQRYGRKMA